MICKDCLLWRNEEEQTRERLANLEIDIARFLGKRVNNPTIARAFDKILDKVYDWLDRKWRRLWAISGTECPQGACILISELDKIAGGA